MYTIKIVSSKANGSSIEIETAIFEDGIEIGRVSDSIQNPPEEATTAQVLRFVKKEPIRFIHEKINREIFLEEKIGSLPAEIEITQDDLA